VRCFAQHVAHFDPATQVPPADAVPARRRTKPYIYSDAEIEALLAAALSLPPTKALRRWTYHSLFGLITVAGLRHSEALNLHRDDVDLDQGVLTIRETKFGKSRLVPLHATAVSVLKDYSARRDAHLNPPRSPYFFVAEQGGGCCINMSIGFSGGCHGKSVFDKKGSATDREFMISATVLRYRP
jgi:integrase